MELWKNTIWVPVVVIALLLGVLLTKGVVLDFVADRVIDRMESRYSPYGPQPPVPHKTSSTNTDNEAGTYRWAKWTTANH